TRKTRSTAYGFCRMTIQDKPTIAMKARPRPMIGEMTIAATVFMTPPQTIASPPALARPAPTSPPTSARELLDGSPRPPSDRVPGDGGKQRREQDAAVDRGFRDDAGAQRLRHLQPEYEEGNKIEDGRPDYRRLRRQHVGRYHCGDRIGG